MKRPKKKKPLISCVSDVHLNDENTYKAPRRFEADTETLKELPIEAKRELVLAILAELSRSLKVLTNAFNVTAEEMEEFLEERTLVTETTTRDTSTDVNINKAIDDIFDEAGEDL